MTNQVCSNCGAAIPHSRRTTCEFCGHELPRQEDAPSEIHSLSDRIQRDLPLVREAPEFAALQQREPPAPPSFAAFKVISGIGTVIACVIGLGMLAFAITVTSFLPESMKLFAIVPLLGLAMVGLFIRMSIKARSGVCGSKPGAVSSVPQFRGRACCVHNLAIGASEANPQIASEIATATRGATCFALEL